MAEAALAEPRKKRKTDLEAVAGVRAEDLNEVDLLLHKLNNPQPHTRSACVDISDLFDGKTGRCKTAARTAPW